MTIAETALAMELWTFAGFMGAAIVLYLTPGADMMFTVASGISGGPKSGLAAAAGISTGVLVHVIIAAAGIAGLVSANPAAYDAIRWAGAAYLGWLAIQTWRATPATELREGRADVWRAFRRGFLTNLMNPKVALFVVALLPQFTDPAIGPISHQILILGLILATGGVIVDGLYGILAGVLADKLRASGKLMNKISAILFGGLAARLALD